jgi:hypothetical protein
MLTACSACCQKVAGRRSCGKHDSDQTLATPKAGFVVASVTIPPHIMFETKGSHSVARNNRMRAHHRRRRVSPLSKRTSPRVFVTQPRRFLLFCSRSCEFLLEFGKIDPSMWLFAVCGLSVVPGSHGNLIQSWLRLFRCGCCVLW